MQPGCRAAVEDAYIRHSNENKLDPPTITEAPPRHPRVNACDPDVRWVKGRPWLDKGAKEMVYSLRPQQLSSSDWYHHGASTTNALDSPFPLINWSNICIVIHHRKKKKQRNETIQHFSAGGRRCYCKISSIHHFNFPTVLWLIKPFLRLMG